MRENLEIKISTNTHMHTHTHTVATEWELSKGNLRTEVRAL